MSSSSGSEELAFFFMPFFDLFDLAFAFFIAFFEFLSPTPPSFTASWASFEAGCPHTVTVFRLSRDKKPEISSSDAAYLFAQPAVNAARLT